MRWDELFRDLEGQLAAAEAADLAAEVADRTRRESALLTLAARAAGARGSRVAVRVRGAGTLEGVLSEAGEHWLLLTEDTGHEALVPTPAVVLLTGLAVWSGPGLAGPGGRPGGSGQVATGLGLGVALRALARDRARVTVLLVDGGTVTGTIDRVGADFVELVDRSAEGPGSAVVRTVATAAVAVVRSVG